MNTKLEYLALAFILGMFAGWVLNARTFKGFMANSECIISMAQAVEGFKSKGQVSGPGTLCVDFKDVPK